MDCPYGMAAWTCEYHLHTHDCYDVCKKKKDQKYEVFDLDRAIEQCPRGYEKSKRIQCFADKKTRS